jgi:ferrous iron transport protein A
MKSLRDAAVGDTVTVRKLHGQGALRRRILDMGVTKGTRLCVRKVAPLGDPIEVKVRGYELSIRKDDAQLIEVESGGCPEDCQCEIINPSTTTQSTSAQCGTGECC